MPVRAGTLLTPFLSFSESVALRKQSSVSPIRLPAHLPNQTHTNTHKKGGKGTRVDCGGSWSYGCTSKPELQQAKTKEDNTHTHTHTHTHCAHEPATSKSGCTINNNGLRLSSTNSHSPLVLAQSHHGAEAVLTLWTTQIATHKR